MPSGVCALSLFLFLPLLVDLPAHYRLCPICFFVVVVVAGGFSCHYRVCALIFNFFLCHCEWTFPPIIGFCALSFALLVDVVLLFYSGSF